MDDLPTPDLPGSAPITSDVDAVFWPLGRVPLSIVVLVGLAAVFAALRWTNDQASTTAVPPVEIERVVVVVERTDAGDLVYRLRGHMTSSPDDLAREIAPVRGPKPPVDLVLGPGVTPGDLHAVLDALDEAGFDDVQQRGA